MVINAIERKTRKGRLNRLKERIYERCAHKRILELCYVQMEEKVWSVAALLFAGFNYCIPFPLFIICRGMRKVSQF